jgi:hypothetical protein
MHEASCRNLQCTYFDCIHVGVVRHSQTDGLAVFSWDTRNQMRSDKACEWSDYLSGNTSHLNRKERDKQERERRERGAHGSMWVRVYEYKLSSVWASVWTWQILQSPIAQPSAAWGAHMQPACCILVCTAYWHNIHKTRGCFPCKGHPIIQHESKSTAPDKYWYVMVRREWMAWHYLKWKLKYNNATAVAPTTNKCRKFL